MAKLHWLLFPSLATAVILSRISLDFYLPALPTIGIFFNATPLELQMTITVFTLGYAISMLISGPLSDEFGRKNILLIGVGMYLAATLACIFSTTIEELIIARFFQALGGCSGTVISRAIIGDLENISHTKQLSLLADITASVAICSLIGPLLAGWLSIYDGWQSLFFCLLALGILLFISVLILPLPRTKINTAARQTFSWKKLRATYKMLLTQRIFIIYSLSAGFAWCGYYAFTVHASFLLQNILGLSPIYFGIAYAAVILGFFVGTQLIKYAAHKSSADTMIFKGGILYCISAIILLFSNLLLPLSWQVLVIPMIFIALGTGIIIPCTQAAVMKPFPTISGTVSGLFFFIQIGIGTLGGGILSLFNKHAQIPLVTMIVLCSIFLLLSCYRLREKLL
jgi:MFS transporter, DHA1 family, multidrug resistance protein